MNLAKSVRILNFDDSLIRQKKLIDFARPSLVDLKGLGPGLRLWANNKKAQEFRRLLVSSQKQAVTFLGSGDFHHITYFLIEQFTQPISVIVFDHHPDWDILPPRYGCGSWVSAALKRGNVQKVVLLGVSSDDINTAALFTANLAALKNDRLEIYPYAHSPSKSVFRKIPANKSCAVKRGLFYDAIQWQELKNKDLGEFLKELVRRMPCRQVYVSIDKDCLRSAYSLTNWEEGYFAIEELLLALDIIKENLEIVGVDIVGDYSLPIMQGTFKGLIARLDHPKAFSAKGKPPESINAVNEETNLKILRQLISS